jgi:hypothetical protein
MRASPLSRLRVALALASVLHALALVSLYGWIRTLRPDMSMRHNGVTAIEVDLLALSEAEPKSEAAALRPTLSAPSPQSAAKLAGATAHPPAGEREGDTDHDYAATPELTAEADDAEPTGDVAPDRAIDLGLGPDGWRKWALLGQGDAPPPSKRKRSKVQPFRAPPASTTGGLLEGLEAQDRKLGLGPSGPVIGALYRAAHSPVAPQTGVARFEVTVLKSGSVQVSLVGASGDAVAWSSVGTLAAEAIRKAPPRIPEPRTGTRVVIAITAEEAFPNGTKRTELSAPHLEAVAPALRSTADAQDKLKELNPVTGDTGAPVTGQTAIVEVPGVFLAGRGKVCSYRLGITPFGPMLAGGCDLANAGSKAQRMVRTQIEEQAMF